MKISEYISACIRFNEDTRKWSGLAKGVFYYACPETGKGWAERTDPGLPCFALESAFHGNVPLAVKAGGWAAQVAYIRENAAQEFINQFLEFVQMGADENYDAEQWEDVCALVR